MSIIRAGGDIPKIEERIPLLSDRFERIGERWDAISPREVEQAAPQVVDDLMMSPTRERQLIAKHGIDPETFSVIRDVGAAGVFYNSYTSPTDGSKIAYSPLYHDENPERLIELLDRFPDDDVINRLRGIRTYQGKPVELVSDPVLREAVKMGCIPTPSVNSTRGEKQFMFTPLQGVGTLEKALLEKARAIIACVRYGHPWRGGRSRADSAHFGTTAALNTGQAAVAVSRPP